jgi:hypothetical protein
MKPCSINKGDGLFWILAVTGLQACAPLTSGNSSTASCMAAIVQNSEGVGLGSVGVTPPGVFISVTTSQLAQSFLAGSATPISTVDLNLDRVGQVNSEVQLDIEADNSTILSATPTSPNNISIGTATAGTSTIQTQAQGPSFIPFDFSANPVTLTPGQIYWLVATPLYSVSSINYIEWRAAAATIAYSLSAYFSVQWQTFSSSINFDFKVGC